ncbi:MAG: AbrB family transcriptional regulator [Synergistaceae bacterium]|jgi:membrane AbrB-like protein|nr:AbrB family transcriptional regulator [Synergistaceae bacterium]
MLEFPGGQIVAFCVMFVTGMAGYFFFRFLRIPNPALLGSMAATGAVNVAGYFPAFPVWAVSFAANATIGLMLGRQIDRNVLGRIKALARPVLIQLAGMIALSLLCGWTLFSMTASKGISLATSLISGTAGGIAEMMIFGMSVDADVAVIAFVQVFRVVIFLGMIPYLAMIAEKLGGVRARPTVEAGGGHSRRFVPRDYAVLVLCVLAGAAMGEGLRVPTGAMLGAMVTSGVYALTLNKKYDYDPRLRVIAQVGLGLVMGKRITPQIVSNIGALLFPALVVTLVMLTGCTLLAVLLYKTSGWDLTTCLLCSAPAGLSQISVFAEEAGADSFTASIFHTVRILGIVSLYPWIVLPFI